MNTAQRIEQIRNDLNDWIINVKSALPMSNDDTAFLLERIEKLEGLVALADEFGDLSVRTRWIDAKKEAGL